MHDLIERLCVAAGMIMEDTAEPALLQTDETEVAGRIVVIGAAGHDIAALAQAAEVLSRRWPAAPAGGCSSDRLVDGPSDSASTAPEHG